MSKSDGMKALNLEMPDRVPRTEYSVLGHPELVSRVTGIPVTSESDAETWKKAQQAFLKAWQFDFMWSVDISHDVFGRYYTDMGHAVYAAGGSDFREVKRCMDIGKNCPGFFMAVGNHIPANTPVDNALWYNECYEKMAGR